MFLDTRVSEKSTVCSGILKGKSNTFTHQSLHLLG